VAGAQEHRQAEGARCARQRVKKVASGSGPLMWEAKGSWFTRRDQFPIGPSELPATHRYTTPRLGIERCGKINASNSGAESWTGIGVVAGFGAVVLIMQ
jgi:hypothetical protein